MTEPKHCICGAGPDPEEPKTHWACGSAKKQRADVYRASECYERQLRSQAWMLRKAIRLIKGYEQMRQNCMGGLSLAVNHGMEWPEDQIILAKMTIEAAEIFMDSPLITALMKET